MTLELVLSVAQHLVNCVGVQITSSSIQNIDFLASFVKLGSLEKHAWSTDIFGVGLEHDSLL